MTGTARMISAVDCRARSVGSVTARATAFGVRTSGVADAVGFISGTGDRTRQTGLHHWLHVEPEAPQEVVWLDPLGIDYHITTSTGLNWRII